MLLNIKKLDKLATLPTRANPTDAGFDLYWNGGFNYPDLHAPHVALTTGIAVEIPEGYVGQIWPRSGMSYKQGTDVLAGIVDCGYTGEVKVILNRMPEGIKTGDRIAQLVVVPLAPIAGINVVQELGESARGEGGFGSTGS